MTITLTVLTGRMTERSGKLSNFVVVVIVEVKFEKHSFVRAVMLCFLLLSGR